MASSKATADQLEGARRHPTAVAAFEVLDDLATFAGLVCKWADLIIREPTVGRDRCRHAVAAKREADAAIVAIAEQRKRFERHLAAVASLPNKAVPTYRRHGTSGEMVPSNEYVGTYLDGGINTTILANAPGVRKVWDAIHRAQAKLMRANPEATVSGRQLGSTTRLGLGDAVRGYVRDFLVQEDLLAPGKHAIERLLDYAKAEAKLPLANRRVSHGICVAGAERREAVRFEAPAIHSLKTDEKGKRYTTRSLQDLIRSIRTGGDARKSHKSNRT